VELFDLQASSGGDSPPPLMFLGDVPEVPFARAHGAPARGELWARIGPLIIALAVLTIVVLVCLVLGYAFGKTVLGA
jgi:hypothetical protein